MAFCFIGIAEAKVHVGEIVERGYAVGLESKRFFELRNACEQFRLGDEVVAIGVIGVPIVRFQRNSF